MARPHRDYDDIPGTYVFDAEHSRKGYHLNMFCMSLSYPRNREAFRADEEALTGVTVEEHQEMMLNGGRSSVG